MKITLTVKYEYSKSSYKSTHKKYIKKYAKIVYENISVKAETANYREPAILQKGA